MMEHLFLLLLIRQKVVETKVLDNFLHHLHQRML
tara:strand:+ start:73 stop:174 length:102 start_codon:yes stop_codon:yes gene_type:complete